MNITFYTKRTPKGFRSFADIVEISIHKGMTGWGRTEMSAINNLIKKWNKKSEVQRNKLIAKNYPNTSVYKLTLTSTL